jgi:hypothetical protein
MARMGSVCRGDTVFSWFLSTNFVLGEIAPLKLDDARSGAAPGVAICFVGAPRTLRQARDRYGTTPRVLSVDGTERVRRRVKTPGGGTRRVLPLGRANAPDVAFLRRIPTSRPYRRANQPRVPHQTFGWLHQRNARGRWDLSHPDAAVALPVKSWSWSARRSHRSRQRWRCTKTRFSSTSAAFWGKR